MYVFLRVCFLFPEQAKCYERTFGRLDPEGQLMLESDEQKVNILKQVACDVMSTLELIFNVQTT